jgi:predicted transcriptional regulator
VAGKAVPQKGIKAATDFIRAVAKAPAAYPETFISLPMDPDLIASVLSRERTRLVQYLLQHGPAHSVHALAEALHRNYASVSRDLGVLIDIGLVAAEQQGRTKELRATGRPVIVDGSA